MKKTAATAVLAMLMLTACSPHADAPSASEAQAAAQPEAISTDVTMDAATQARMGVQVTAITTVRAASTVRGYARVMDVGPLAALNAEVTAARAMASTSQAEYRRLQALAAMDQAASARAVDMARAQAAADAARSGLASGRIGLEWGAGVGQLSEGERTKLLSDIATGRAALVRVDAPGVDGSVSRVTLHLDNDGSSIPTTRLGAAGAADARLQTAGVLVVVRGTAVKALPAGRLIQADLETGASRTGFLLPRSALLRSGGSVSVYVRTARDTFQPREVVGARSITQGWFVTEGFTSGEMIVSEGAASLLAADRGPVEAE